MSKEFKAGDTITAESLNGIAEGVYTFKSGEILTASKLNTISEAIEDKDEEIAELQAQVEELQAEIDAFPTIESKSITANGTYSEEGKAYSPVVVNVPQTTVVPLNVTQNGTYSEQGKAYSPVTVNVAQAINKLVNSKIEIVNNTNHNIQAISLTHMNNLESYFEQKVIAANSSGNVDGGTTYYGTKSSVPVVIASTVKLSLSLSNYGTSVTASYVRSEQDVYVYLIDFRYTTSAVSGRQATITVTDYV